MSMINTELSIQVDYHKDGKYALMIGDPFLPNEVFYFDGVLAIFPWVIDKYGDTPVELSQMAHLILTVEMGLSSDAEFSQ